MQLGQNQTPHFVHWNQRLIPASFLQHFAHVSLAMSLPLQLDLNCTCTFRNDSSNSRGRGAKGAASRTALTAA